VDLGDDVEAAIEFLIAEGDGTADEATPLNRPPEASPVGDHEGEPLMNKGDDDELSDP
jgi:hypothetical protein